MSDTGQCMSYLATSIASAPNTSRFAISGHPCVLLLNTDQSRERGKSSTSTRQMNCCAGGRNPALFIFCTIKRLSIHSVVPWNANIRVQVYLDEDSYNCTHLAFLCPSSILCSNWLHHWRGTFFISTHLFTEIAIISITLQAPFVKKYLKNPEVWVWRPWK